MKRQERLWFGVTVALLVLSLVLAGCGTAPQANPAPSQAPVVSAPAAAAPEALTSTTPEKPGAEGIQVHGRWIIEVTNPDGTMAEKREFENSLTTGDDSGATFLARVLSREASVTTWGIVLGDPGVAQTPFLSNGIPSYGWISESGYSNANLQGNLFQTLTVSVPISGANAYELVFNGSATAQQDGQISLVSTKVLVATNGYFGNFTRKVLTAPISLSAGQQINVTVVISFS